jgi:hypothetical protein
MKAMLNETAVDIMGLLPEHSWGKTYSKQAGSF